MTMKRIKRKKKRKKKNSVGSETAPTSIKERRHIGPKSRESRPHDYGLCLLILAFIFCLYHEMGL